MLKVPDHQVAGHKAGAGTLGPLIDDAGNFYKPLQSDERGAKEVAFYSGFSKETRIPNEIRNFFPVFHGTKDLEASDGSGMHPHLILEDIVSSRTNPSILDIKMGASTWYPEASEQYITKCLKKDREGTSLTLGFRICGLQFYGNKETGYWKPERKLVNGFNHDDVCSALRKFVSSNSPSDSDAEPDCSYASTIYGGPDGIVSQLLKLKSWFEEQTIYHFYSCSIMLVYDKESILKGENPNPQIKLVDFAHVMEGKAVGEELQSHQLLESVNAMDQDYVALKNNLQDTCPTSFVGKQTIFVNGFPCKNPNIISAPDFKTSKLTEPGDTDNFFGSAVTMITAAEFPGLNTLGLSIARTDLRLDGLVRLHSHPRATEMFFVTKGLVLAGFIDTLNQPFQTILKEGDVFVFPRGLLHFCLNAGYDIATALSVFNSQNPGVVSISDAMFEPKPDVIKRLTKGYVTGHFRNGTLSGTRVF